MLDVLIRDLEWLLTLAEHGHVTDTAAILGVSQPTLSRSLTRLEDELGARLFERVPAGVQLNPTGDLVVAAARDIVDRHAQLRSDLDTRLDPEAGVVRLAFLDSMATSLVPQMLRAFHAHAPRTKVLLAQEPHHDIMRDLTTGEAELGVTTIQPAGPFGWLTLQHERLVAVVPPTHRLRDRKRITLRDLAGDELITTPVGFGYRAVVQQLMAEDGVALRISFESADLATIEGLVAAGLGVAILPEQLAGVNGTISLALRSPLARRTVGLTWRTDHAQAPPAERMLSFLRDTWKLDGSVVP